MYSFPSSRLHACFSLLVVVATVGCKRHAATTTAPSASVAVGPSAPVASSSFVPVVVPADVLAEPPKYGEAVRATLATAGYGELLQPVRDLVDARFPGVSPKELEVQVVSAGGARRAVFVQHHAPGTRPLLFAFDGGALAWTKERPTGGLDPSITEIAMAPGPNGDVVMTWCDPPSGLVAARRWESGGGLLVDYKVVALDGCDALSTIWWPEHGWLVVPSKQGAAKAQLLTEKGKLAWGPEGRIVTFGWRARDPMTLALDTDDSAMIFFRGKATTPTGAPDRFFAVRYDDRGNPAWKAPLELGEAPPGPAAKIAITRSQYGAVHAYLERDANGTRAPYEVDVTTDGRVVLR